jgi:hypothetical protein
MFVLAVFVPLDSILITFQTACRLLKTCRGSHPALGASKLHGEGTVLPSTSRALQRAPGRARRALSSGPHPSFPCLWLRARKRGDGRLCGLVACRVERREPVASLVATSRGVIRMHVGTLRRPDVAVPEPRGHLLEIPAGGNQRRAVRVAQAVERRRVLDDQAITLDRLEPGALDGRRARDLRCCGGRAVCRCGP